MCRSVQDMKRRDGTACLRQELGIPYLCRSTSEPVAHYRNFHCLNHRNNIQHAHQTLQDQLEGKPCCLHPTSESCVIAGNPDILVIGAPCNPFSVMRPKRFQPNSVVDHEQFSLTHDGVIDVLRRFTPASAIMETTDGFCKPIAKGQQETPYSLRLGLM